MTYKKKFIALSSLAAVLALVYILTFVLDPENRRSSFFAWLDPALLVMADGIEIEGPQGSTVLSRKNNTWVFPAGAMDYPVKQGRVEDLLAVLCRREAYPLRASSTGARERLGLAEGRASRIVVRGGAGLPLLELEIGTGDALGREVYVSRAGKREIFSGEDRFTFYTDPGPASWYDLRLFPSEPARNSAAGVQQADITLPDGAGSYTLRRGRTETNGVGWIMLGNESVALDAPRVEAWLRSVLDAEGEGFDDQALESVEGSIILRFGDGSARTVQAGPEDEQGSRGIMVSDSPFVYVLSEWTLNRLFRERAYFINN